MLSDSIGRDGVSFSNAYAGHATCAPSRAALLTGRYLRHFLMQIVWMGIDSLSRYASRVGYEFTPTHPAYVKILGTSDKALRKGKYLHVVLSIMILNYFTPLSPNPT